MFTVRRYKLQTAWVAVAALPLILSGRAGAAPAPGLAPERVLAGPCAPGASYDASCDVDHDGDVDIFDIQLAAGHWNQSGTWSGGDFWALTGNAGTTAGAHFLGTTDLEPLELRVAGQRALRLEPVPAPPDGAPAGGDQTPNVIGGHAANAVTLYVQGATIGGGGATNAANQVFDDFGTVAGGMFNAAGDGIGTLNDQAWATVGGGAFNQASSVFATVAGGGSNAANGQYAAVSGGYYNQANGTYATVGGGFDNGASGPYATVSGGSVNSASGSNAVVSGGYGNIAIGEQSTVGGGYYNQANGTYATVGGGYVNLATSTAATVAGGSFNRASGGYSFAAGRRAKADHTGAYVWADATDADFASTANNQFLVRAAGGVGINTNAPNAALAVDGGNSVARIAVNSNTPTANAGLSLRQDGVNRWSIAAVSADGDLTFFREGAGGGSRLFVDGGGANAGNVGIGNAAPQYPLHMASGAHVTAGGTWTNASSRQLKTGFIPADGQTLLETLAALPITTWSYRAEDPAVRHLGPTAEDFYAAFQLGRDNGAITTVDADGVALTAIQALHRLNQTQQAQLASQQQQIERLEARLAALEQRGQPDRSPWLLLATMAAGLLLATLAVVLLLRTARRTCGISSYPLQ